MVNPIVLLIGGVFLLKYIATAATANSLEFEIKDLKFQVINLYTSVVKLQIDVINKGNQSITLNSIDAYLFVNGVKIGRIIYKGDLSINLKSHSILNDLKIELSNVNTASSIIELLQNVSNFSVELKGNCYADNKYLPLNIKKQL